MNKYRGELVLSVAWFVTSLALRLPNLLSVPRFTDEGFEVLWGLDIALGRHLPLTGVDVYDGPFFAYLMAGLFKVFGLNLLFPRLTSAIFGALAVVAMYWLGRLMFGRLAGFIAASLTATSAVLVVFGSHYGWSSSLTPSFAMLTLVALYAGLAQNRNWLIVSSGLLAALTLQTHPTSLVLFIGALIWLLARQELRTRSNLRAMFVGLALFVLGYAPMIVANLRPASPVAQVASEGRSPFQPTLSPIIYAARIVDLGKNLVYIIGGGIGANTPALRVIEAVTAFVLLIGLVWTWRHGQRLIAWIFISTLLLLPVFVDSFSFRYFASLIPLAFITIGALVAELWRTLSVPHTNGILARADFRRVAKVATGLVVGVFVAYPLLTISSYYQGAARQGMTNDEYLRLGDVVAANQACGDHLFVEETSLNNSYFIMHSIDYVLALRGCRHVMLPPEAISQFLSQPASTYWLIAPEWNRPTFAQQFTLEPVATISAPPNIEIPLIAISFDRVGAAR